MTVDPDLTKRALLAEIEAEARQVAPATGRKELSPRVIAALQRVPRDMFVPAELKEMAWDNRPLPIGHGQTISQPFIVAVMTDLLQLTASDRILEIGTGSGYQCALLAELARRVFTVERVADLSRQAQRRLAELGYTNIEFRVGDGHQGWPEHAPFDAIIVTAAAPQPPADLVAQLAPAGRMIIPLGESGLFATQMLSRITRSDDGAAVVQPLLAVAFVPLVEGDPVA